ncbi:MAG TPA: hypothetical protein VIU38_12660 [Anaerolineales bacterium]
MDKVKSRRRVGLPALHVGFVVVTLSLLAAFATVPSPFSADLGDKFRWHAELVALFARIRYDAGDRVFHDTLRGSEGWIFFAGDASLKDFQGLGRLAPRDLEKFRRGMDKLNGYLAQRGTALLVVIVPDKSTTYASFMPKEIPVLGSNSLRDQFVQYMNDRGNFNVLDLAPALNKYTDQGRLYYKTDSHWNDLGAYYGYVEIMHALSRTLPQLRPRPLADFDLQWTVSQGTTDLPYIMGGLDLPEESPELRLRQPEPYSSVATRLSTGDVMVVDINPSGPPFRVLVFGDSFSEWLRQFLVLDFGRVTTVPYHALGGDEVYSWIEREAPDVVIIEVGERLLGNLLPKFAGAGP